MDLSFDAEGVDVRDSRGWAMRHGRKRRMAGRRDECGGPKGHGRAVFSRSCGKFKAHCSRYYVEPDHKARVDFEAESRYQWNDYRDLVKDLHYVSQESEHVWNYYGHLGAEEFYHDNPKCAIDIDTFVHRQQHSTDCIWTCNGIEDISVNVLRKAGALRWERAVATAACIAAEWGCAPVVHRPDTTTKLESTATADTKLEIEAEAALANVAAAMLDRGLVTSGEGVQDAFAAVRQSFLKQHGSAVLQNLQLVFRGPISLKPTPLAEEIMNNFLGVYGENKVMLPTFHGTKSSNFASIFSKGLLIPGSSSSCTLSNGACHGLGIYVSKMHNAPLARGFCSEPRMLVCAVLDDAVKIPPRQLCNFVVTAESSNTRHVGDAIVVFDPKRVVPLFEATGAAFLADIAHHPRFVPSAFTPALPAYTPPAHPVPVVQQQLVQHRVPADEKRQSIASAFSVRARMGHHGKKISVTKIEVGFSAKVVKSGGASMSTHRRSFQGAPWCKRR